VNRHARVVCTVEYRQGDGTTLLIPPGPCDVEVTEADVTIGWTAGETRNATAIPRADFAQHLACGNIVFDADPPA